MVEREVRKRRPESVRDVLMFEQQSGKMFEDAVDDGYFDGDSFGNDLQNTINEIDGLQNQLDL